MTRTNLSSSLFNVTEAGEMEMSGVKGTGLLAGNRKGHVILMGSLGVV